MRPLHIVKKDSKRIQVAKNKGGFFISAIPVGNASPSMFYIKPYCVGLIPCVRGIVNSWQGFMWRGNIIVLIWKFKLGSVDVEIWMKKTNKQLDREQIVGKEGGRKLYTMWKPHVNTLKFGRNKTYFRKTSIRKIC